MKKILVLILASILLFSFVGCSQDSGNTPDKDITSTDNKPSSPDVGQTPNPDTTAIVYSNTDYGFDFTLPKSWEGYTILAGTWKSNNPNMAESGPEITIRNPLWTEREPYQDIPILVFTPEQWKKISNEDFNVSAAPIPPSKLGENTQYIFALPPRYNFAYPEGFEEVEKILEANPLVDISLTGDGSVADSSTVDDSEVPVDN